MRKRNIQFSFRLNENEAQKANRYIKKSGLSKEAYLRFLALGYEPKEKPDDRFYEAMRELSAIGNNLHQISRKANALGFVDAPLYKRVYEQLQEFQLDIRRKFLLPEKTE